MKAQGERANIPLILDWASKTNQNLKGGYSELCIE